MATAKKTPAKPGKPTAPAKKTAAAAPAAPKPPKAEKPAKEPKPKVEKVEANGVTRPKAGTKTGRVWEIADELSAKHKRPATRAEVMEVAIAKPDEINEATVATQYQRWRTFFGIERQAPAPKPEKPAKPTKPAKGAAAE